MLLQKVQRGDFAPPRRVKPSVPRALEAVCLKAMAARPQDRYPSPRDLADDVEHWLADEPVAAYPEPWAARLSRFWRRHRALAASAVALLVTAVVALSISTLLVGREQARTEEARVEAVNNFNDARRAEEKTREALGVVRAQELELRRRLVRIQQLGLDAGSALCEAGRIELGMCSLLQTYQDVGDDRPLRGDALRLLAGWGSSLEPGLFHGGAVTGVAFSPDSRLAAARGNWDESGQGIRLWDVATGKEVGEPIPFRSDSGKLVMGPSGKMLIAGTTVGGQEAVVYDIGARKPVGKPMRHDAKLREALFSPDGARVLTSANDKTARLWDAATGEPIGEPLRHENDVTAMAFSPDGRILVTLAKEGARL